MSYRYKLVKASHDLLLLLVSVDFGKSITKLVMSVINVTTPLSVKQSRVLAMYEGAKDSYEPMKLIFKPIFDQFIEIQENISCFNIKTPTGRGKNPFKASAEVISQQCNLCVDKSICNKYGIYMSKKRPIKKIDIPDEPVNKLEISYGGDYEGIVQLLGKLGNTVFGNNQYS